MSDKLLDVIFEDESDNSFELSLLKGITPPSKWVKEWAEDFDEGEGQKRWMDDLVANVTENTDKLITSLTTALNKVGEMPDGSGKKRSLQKVRSFLNQLSSETFGRVYELSAKDPQNIQKIGTIPSIKRGEGEEEGLYSFFIPRILFIPKDMIYSTLEIISKSIPKGTRTKVDTNFEALLEQKYDLFFGAKFGLDGVTEFDKIRSLTRKSVHSLIVTLSISIARTTFWYSYLFPGDEIFFKELLQYEHRISLVMRIATIIFRRLLNLGLMIPFDITKVKRKTRGMGVDYTYYQTSRALSHFNATWCSYTQVTDNPEEQERIQSQILALLNTDKALQIRGSHFDENHGANSVLNDIRGENIKKLTFDSASPNTLSFFHGCYNLINYIQKSESLKKIEVVRKPTKKVVTPTREPTKEKGKEPEVVPSRPEPSRKIVRKGEESSLIEIEKVSTFTNNMFDGFSKLSENDPAISILRNDVKKYSEMGTEKFKAFIAKMGGGYFKAEEKRLKRGTKRELIYTGIQIRDEYIQSRVYANDLIREKGCSGSVISVKERRGITTNQYESPKKGKTKKKYSNKFVFPKGVYPVDE